MQKPGLRECMPLHEVWPGLRLWWVPGNRALDSCRRLEQTYFPTNAGSVAANIAAQANHTGGCVCHVMLVVWPAAGCVACALTPIT